MRKKPYFSIVIPTLNEELYLPSLLTDLTKQVWNDFEVIVVDGRSSDQTVDLAEKFSTELALTIFTTKKRNVGYQRNLGGGKAKGQWVIFLDADVRIPKHFLVGLVYQLEKHNTTDVFTVWMTADQLTPENQAIANFINIGIELMKKVKPAAMGDMIGVRRTVLDKVKFDAQQHFAEDIEFVQQAVKRGHRYQVFREPKRVVSFRRLRREGKLKMAGVFAVNQIKVLRGDKFLSPVPNYPMKGGSYYKHQPDHMLALVNHFISQLSATQLKRIRQFVKSVR